MKQFIKNNKQIFWFFGFALAGICYYGSKLLQSNPTAVHIGLDDKIPFLPIFIIPYVSWFVYVPLCMLLVCFTDKKYFPKQCIILFAGIVFSTVMFLLFPTCVDFRPSAEGKGLLLWICRIVYKNDTPAVNAFPSLHCYEAMTVHLTAFVSGPFKNKRALRTTSALLMILICLSTVFVKQHSVLDVFAGCGLAVVFWWFFAFIFNLRGKNNVGVKNI